jgi:hypothetical protein
MLLELAIINHLKRETEFSLSRAHAAVRMLPSVTYCDTQSSL